MVARPSLNAGDGAIHLELLFPKKGELGKVGANGNLLGRREGGGTATAHVGTEDSPPPPSEKLLEQLA